MLTVESFGRLPGEARHLKLVDHETLTLNTVDNLAHLSVAVWLNHSKGSLSLRFELPASSDIAIVDDFQDTRENSDLCPNEKVVKLDRWNLLLLEEDSGVLYIEHLDGREDGEIKYAIRPDDIGLLIVPFDLKSELLLTQGQSCHNCCNLIFNL